MVLNNLKYWLQTFLFNGTALTYSSSASYKAFKTPLITVEGVELKNYNPNKITEQSLLGFMMSTVNPVNNGVYISLGNGSTNPTTAETYRLDSDITSNFSLGTITSNVDFPNGKIRLVLTAQYTNNTDEAITINEIGLNTNISWYASGWTRGTILLDRKSVVDGNFAPVTVGAGESRIFVYALEL